MTDTDELDVDMRRVKLGDLKLLDAGRNARFMRHEQMARLVANIRRDGTLTSVPLASIQDDGSLLVLSGNHRVIAAVDALGADTEVWVMVTTTPLTDQRALATQLSHNAIVGEDDPAVLAALYDELDQIDWREYTGLDDKTLALLEQVQIGSLSEANLEFQSITISFLPEDLQAATDVFDEAKSYARDADAHWLARFAEWDLMIDALNVAGRTAGVNNVATTLALVLEVFKANVHTLKDVTSPDPANWISIPVLLGWEMPPDAALVVERALRKIQEQAQTSQPWQALELLAADWLAGAP